MMLILGGVGIVILIVIISEYIPLSSVCLGCMCRPVTNIPASCYKCTASLMS